MPSCVIYFDTYPCKVTQLGHKHHQLQIYIHIRKQRFRDLTYIWIPG